MLTQQLLVVLESECPVEPDVRLAAPAAHVLNLLMCVLMQAPATYSSSDCVDSQAVLTQQLLVELESEILVELDFRLAAVVTVKHFKGAVMQQLCYTNKAAAEDPSSSSSSSAAGSSGSKAAAATAEPSDTPVTSDDSSARKDASAPPAAAAGAVGMSRRQLDRLFCMTSYLTEVSLLEYRLLAYQPSAVASAAFVYAHILLGLGFTSALQMTGYTLPELSGLLDIFCALHATLSGALRLGRPYNVTSKYRSAAVCGVANIPPVTIPAEQRLGGW